MKLQTTVSGFFNFRTPVGVKIKQNAPISESYDYTINVEAASETEARTRLLDLCERIEKALGLNTTDTPWIDLKRGDTITVRYRNTERVFCVTKLMADGSFELMPEEQRW